MTHNTLHVIGAWCVAHDFHTVVSWPLECKCWRQFAAQWGDYKKSWTASLNAIIIIINYHHHHCIMALPVSVPQKGLAPHKQLEIVKLFRGIRLHTFSQFLWSWLVKHLTTIVKLYAVLHLLLYTDWVHTHVICVQPIFKYNTQALNTNL